MLEKGQRLRPFEPIWDYSQPTFYHFSEDSVWLSKIAAGYLGSSSTKLNVLDLCAGCGVIGIEIYQLQREKNIHVTFVELQVEFSKHLTKNVKKVMGEKGKVEIENLSYFNIGQTEKYDLIVANPPYYFRNNFRVGQNLQKNICRFDLHFNWAEFANCIARCLSQMGKCLFLNPLKNEEWLKKYFGSSLVLKEEKGDLGIFEFTLLDFKGN